MLVPFNLAGTGGRGALLGWTLVFQLVAVALIVGGPLDRISLPWRLLVHGLFAISFAAWMVAIVRRLHDLGRSGWYSILFPLPVIGIALLVWALFAQPRPVDPERFAQAPRYVIGGLVLVVLVAAFTSRAVWVPHRIVTAQMAPTLAAGSLFLSVPLRLRDVVPGQVVTYSEGPGDKGINVGRVIAVAGQMLAIRAGVPVLDGVAAGRDTCGRRVTCAVETLPNGASYTVHDRASDQRLDVAARRVPEGRVFILPDNRDTLLPSAEADLVARLIPAEALLGRVIYPPAGGAL